MFEKKNVNIKKCISMILLMSLLVICLALPDSNIVRAASDPQATGKINSAEGAYIRNKPSQKGSKVLIAKDNTKVVITQEIFTAESTKAQDKWYRVTVSDKTGYVRSDLVDTIKYTSVDKLTTDALNYRTGPSTLMSKKGTKKKGTTLSAVLPAQMDGLKDVWYKVKIGNNYYYVSSKYTKDVNKSSGAANASSNSAKTTSSTNVTNSASTNKKSFSVIDEKGKDTGIKVTDITYPTSISEGSSFGLKGTISGTKTITSVTVGIANTSGKWLVSEKRDVGNSSFDIHSVDAKIKFGTLKAGSYYYKITIETGGKTYVAANYKFNVVHLNGPQSIAKTAVALAWPVGTSSSKYKYKGGSASSAYKKALDVAYPTHNKWGKVTKVGASCDVFVGTVCRYSGYDKSMPSGLQAQRKYLASSKKWNLVNYHYKESELRDGDIIIYKRSNGQGHVCIYCKVNGKGCLIEAAYKDKYGYVNTSIKKAIKPASNVIELKVYRAAS